MSRAKPDNGDASRYSSANDNGYLGNVNSFGSLPLPKDEPVSSSAALDPSRLLDPRLEGSKKSMGSVTPLKEFASFKEFSPKRQGSPRFVISHMLMFNT